MASELTLHAEQLPAVCGPKSPGRERLRRVVTGVLAGLMIVAAGALLYLVFRAHWLRLLIPTVTLLTVWGLVWLLVRDYRKALGVWLVEHDLLNHMNHRSVTVFSFEDVTAVRLEHRLVVLHFEDREPLKLPPDVSRALRHSNLVPRLVERLQQQIEEQGDLQIGSNRFQALANIGGGFCLVVAGIATLHFWHLAHAVGMVSRGARDLGSGFVITPTGIKADRRQPDETAWCDIANVSLDHRGAVITTRDARLFKAMQSMDNYLAIVALVVENVRVHGNDDVPLEIWPEA